MGGFLLKYEGQCDVILLTDGAKGNRDWTEEKTREVRKKEFATAMKWAEVRKWETWNIPDLELAKYTSRLQGIDLKKYRYVLVPNRNETHLGHRVIYDVIKKILKEREQTQEYLNMRYGRRC